MRGTFDADRHHFHNSSHEEIVTELQQAFAAIRAVNPRMKFLLTVSPVPLTATATPDHVLTVQTADQQRFANLLLTVGVRMD